MGGAILYRVGRMPQRSGASFVWRSEGTEGVNYGDVQGKNFPDGGTMSVEDLRLGRKVKKTVRRPVQLEQSG